MSKLSPFEIRAALDFPQPDPDPKLTIQTTPDHLPNQRASRLRATLSDTARLRGTTWEELKAIVQE